MESALKIVGAFVLAVLLGVVIAVLMALPVMWLWNYVMPYLFSLREIDFPHAMGLVFLCQSLFKFSNSTTKESK